MQLGTPKWEAAEYLGMTPKQLDDVYGHHHPDHLKAPRDAFDRPPPDRHRIPRTKQEPGETNVTRITKKSVG
jgi:hypothetical protein